MTQMMTKSMKKKMMMTMGMRMILDQAGAKCMMWKSVMKKQHSEFVACTTSHQMQN